MDSQTKYCLNCGTEVVGQFCHECGQKTDNYHRSLRRLLIHFLDEFFTFDSKFFRSLIPLLIKPGRLTNEYLSGKQVSYVAPFRLYFFTVIVFLFVQSVWNPYKVMDMSSGNRGPIIQYGDNTSKKTDQEEVAEVKTSTENTSSENSDRENTDKAAEDLPENAEAVSPMLQKFLDEKGEDSDSAPDGTSERNNSSAGGDLLGKIVTNATDLDGDVEAQKRFTSRFFQMTPNMLIVLMPFFALMLKILNLRWKEFYYVDHFIFSLHYHAFGFFLLIILAPLQQFFSIAPVFIVAAIVYLFLAQRRVYKRARWRTSIKTFLLFIFYGLLLSIGLVVVIVIEVINLKG